MDLAPSGRHDSHPVVESSREMANIGLELVTYFLSRIVKSLSEKWT